jgi:hypothetical protein
MLVTGGHKRCAVKKMVSATEERLLEHTLLVKNEDIAAVQVDGVSGTQAGH